MKVAISLPDPLFSAAEKLATSLRKSRSDLYATALEQFIERHMAHDVTRRLDEVYTVESTTIDAPLARAQTAVLTNETW